MCDIKPTREQIKQFRDDLFANKQKNRPVAIVMVGGPASGKSIAQKDCVKKLRLDYKNFVVIDPDEIIIKLFNINNLCREEVCIINDQNFDIAIRQKYNLVFDGTGKNFDWTYNDVIKKLHSKGYKVVLCMTVVDVKKAIHRSRKRAKLIGRSVSKEFLEAAYIQLKIAMPKYFRIKNDLVDDIFVYDMNKKMKILFERNSDGVFTCKLHKRIAKLFPNELCDICKICDV